jgi:hypothetical protein
MRYSLKKMAGKRESDEVFIESLGVDTIFLRPVENLRDV